MYVNHFLCCGRLVATPEMRDHKGSSYAKFSIALNKPKSETVYLDCIAWGQSGSFLAQYARKGQEVFLSGELDIHSYEDKQGVRRRSLTLAVKECSLGSPPREEGTAPIREVSIPRLSPAALVTEDKISSED